MLELSIFHSITGRSIRSTYLTSRVAFFKPNINGQQPTTMFCAQAVSAVVFNSPNVFRGPGSSNESVDNTWLPTTDEFDNPNLSDNTARLNAATHGSKRKLDFHDCSGTIHDFTNFVPAQPNSNPTNVDYSTNEPNGYEANTGNPNTGIVLYTRPIRSVPFHEEHAGEYHPQTPRPGEYHAQTPRPGSIPRWTVQLECLRIPSAKKQRAQAKSSPPPTNIDVIVLDDDENGASSSTHGSLN